MQDLLRAFSAKHVFGHTWAYMSRLSPRIPTQAFLIFALSAQYIFLFFFILMTLGDSQDM
jgi:hypothetical protein